MHLCQIVPSLEERHGGPSKSVLGLARGLAALGPQVDLLTTAPTDEARREEGSLRIRAFRRTFPSALFCSTGLAQTLEDSPADLIHHHALWLRTLHYAHAKARRAHVPLVLSPRGMMSPWAWNFHAGRKRIARALVHPGAFHAASGWHATSTEEADDIRALGFKQPVCVAPNGVVPPTAQETADAIAHWQEACPDVTRRPTAVFYSRFHRKKRVLELIDLWLAHAPADWLLLMVGLPEEFTPSQLETYVLRASGGGRVRVFDGESRPVPYPVASLFLLPSHSENFGLVIAEAMAHGLPALVTDSTPWGVLNRESAGWCVPWESYAETLRAVLAEPPASLAARGREASRLVLRDYSWTRSAGLLLDFYRQLRPRSSPS